MQLLIMVDATFNLSPSPSLFLSCLSLPLFSLFLSSLSHTMSLRPLTLWFCYYSVAPEVRWLVGLSPLCQGLRDKPVQEGEGGVNLEILAGRVQRKNSLHHSKVLTQLN